MESIINYLQEDGYIIVMVVILGLLYLLRNITEDEEDEIV
jgi:hypothetical protein